MPIKPENKARYPKDWKAIRAEVLERAGHKCEWDGCGIANGERGLRDLDGKWWPSKSFMDGDVPEDVLFEKYGGELRKAYRIVLTIAHRDHIPENNGEPGNRPNLAAWCQYHHLKYDKYHHLKNSKETRNKNRLTVDLL